MSYSESDTRLASVMMVIIQIICCIGFFDAKYGELLGGHMIGANVTEMIAEIVALRKLETTGHELIKTIHPHPTLSEAVMEAAAAAYDEVIHL